jgi:hypothetical protein
MWLHKDKMSQRTRAIIPFSLCNRKMAVKIHSIITKYSSMYPVNNLGRFEGWYCLYLQGEAVQEVNVNAKGSRMRQKIDTI